MPTVDLTRIGSNIGAMYSLQSLLDINNKLAAAQSKLSTGKRINSAADDPAGLVIATKMHTRSEGLKVAMDNISDAKNMLSVAESGLSKLTDIITQMRTKATQAASDTLGATERKTIQAQLTSFSEQIDNIIDETKWNGVKLLDGTASKTFQTGVDEKENTIWTLASKHDATTLAVSKKVTAAQVDASGTLATSKSSAVAVNGLSELSTGTYKFSVISSTATNSGAMSNTSNNTSGSATVSFGVGIQSAGSNSEIAAGNHVFTFTTGSITVSGSTFMTMAVLDKGTAVGGSFVVGGSSYVGGTVTGGSTIAQLQTAGTFTQELYANNSGSDLGISITLSGLGTAIIKDSGAGGGSILSGGIGGAYTFDYVKKNTATVALLNNDGIALTIKTADGSSSGSSVTVTGGTTLDTGRGLSISLGMGDALSAGATAGTLDQITYTQKNDHSVDVSTAAKAGAYMTTLDSALDLVNSSMADLGSLMARMDIKQIVASSAQINVESAYNRIMNANMAEEQVNASKYQVLQQTAVAMLAQSNQAPQAILSLFK